MTPEARIARLDRQLATKGQNIVLRRRKADGSGWASVTCRGKVTGFEPAELVGDIAQQNSRIILSPTQIEAANWPGGGNGSPTPQKGDTARIQGENKTVLAATAIAPEGKVVRIEMLVRGTAS